MHTVLMVGSGWESLFRRVYVWIITVIIVAAFMLVTSHVALAAEFGTAAP